MDQQKAVQFNIDMRGPSPSGDCLDGIVAFPAAVDQMRETGDEHELPHTMFAGTMVAFQTLEPGDRDGLLLVAANAQDLLYRHIARLTIMDRYTQIYCARVIRCFFQQLSLHNVRTFYILDNALREDRLEALLELFELSGIATATPGRDGTSWPALSERISTGLDTLGHVAYIEPDARVNHLELAQKLAGTMACVATFRNLSPDEPRHQVISVRGA